MLPLLPPDFFHDEIEQRQLRILHACQDAGLAWSSKRMLVATVLLAAGLIGLALGGPRLAYWYAAQRLINTIPLVDDARRWDETVDIKPECGAIRIERGYVTELSEQQIINFYDTHREGISIDAFNLGYSALGRPTLSFAPLRVSMDGSIISGGIAIIDPGLLDNNDPVKQQSLVAQRQGKTFFTTSVVYIMDLERYNHGPCNHD